MTAREIEAARRAISRYVKRGGRIWIRVFPDVPITQKPLEVRMGSGKGNVEYWVAKVLPGKVLFEIEGMSEEIAREAFRLASAKLSVSTAFVEATSAGMKAKDLRDKAPEALGEELLKLRREQFNLRMARATGQAAKPDQFAKSAQEHCTREDGARPAGARARAARPEVDRQRKRRIAEHKRERRRAPQAGQRLLTGKVVSNKMDKTIAVSDRAPGEAPDLRQVHSPHHEASGA